MNLINHLANSCFSGSFIVPPLANIRMKEVQLSEVLKEVASFTYYALPKEKQSVHYHVGSGCPKYLSWSDYNRFSKVVKCLSAAYVNYALSAPITHSTLYIYTSWLSKDFTIICQISNFKPSKKKSMKSTPIPVPISKVIKRVKAEFLELNGKLTWKEDENSQEISLSFLAYLSSNE